MYPGVDNVTVANLATTVSVLEVACSWHIGAKMEALFLIGWFKAQL